MLKKLNLLENQSAFWAGVSELWFEPPGAQAQNQSTPLLLLPGDIGLGLSF
jgi:hypothetical protein